MLAYCNDHIDPEKEDDKFQSFAVIGVAMIAMGEDIGTEMAMRAFNHLVSFLNFITFRCTMESLSFADLFL
jgi:26S proteasome regulatory subunit N1